MNGSSTRRRAAWLGGLLIGLLAVVCPRAAQAQPGKDKDPLSWDRNLRGMFQKYCHACHNSEHASADVDLAKDTNPRQIAKQREKWRLVSHVLAGGDMPPSDADVRPTPEERELMIRFLDETLGSLNCEKLDDPGPPPLRRLNRTEYDLALSDLLGLELRLAEDFPPDPSSYGFDNIGPALVYSPVQIEQYHAAAQKAARAVSAARESSPEVYERVFGTNERPDPDAARELIRRFADRAFRRPAAEPLVARLTRLYEQGRAAELDHRAAMEHVVTAVLIAPQFLMRVEQTREDESRPYRVDDYELASRLSFFLWSRPPDEELLQLAASGELSQPETLEAQALRMLKDPRGRALVDHFFGQWLGFRGLRAHQVDLKVFPEYDDELARLMLAEVSALLEALLVEDRPIAELIDADYTFLNERLAKHYGLEAAFAEAPDDERAAESPADEHRAATRRAGEFGLRRVRLPDRRRGGVLTTAALLMIQSDPNRANIPRRGAYLAERVLGSAPPPPPPDVPALEEMADGREIPLRELLEKHRSSPACAGCHARIDPLGFSLQNFDAIGRWRTHEAGHLIDASGELADGTVLNGPVELKDMLLRSRAEFSRALSKNLLIYALGRGLEEADECVLQDMAQATASAEARFSTLVLTVVKSRPFLYRRNPEF